MFGRIPCALGNLKIRPVRPQSISRRANVCLKLAQGDQQRLVPGFEFLKRSRWASRPNPAFADDAKKRKGGGERCTAGILATLSIGFGLAQAAQFHSVSFRELCYPLQSLPLGTDHLAKHHFRESPFVGGH